MRVRSFVALTAPCILLTSCCPSNATRPVSLKEALGVLEEDLRNVGTVSLSDVDSIKAGDVRLFNAIGLEQCLQKTPNPLVPVVTGPIGLQLQGQFQVAGQVGFTISASPSIGAQGSAQQQKSQQVTVSMTFVSLAGLPNLYFGQNMANFASLPDTQKAERAKVLLSTRDKLAEWTTTMIEKYAKDVQPKCESIMAGQTSAGPLVFPSLVFPSL